MVVYNIPNIPQEKIPELFEGFDMVCAYIDGLIVTTKYKFVDHLKTLENVLHTLVEVGLKVNTGKLFSGCTETDYMGF